MIFQLILVQVITFGVMVFILHKLLKSSSTNETSRLQQLNEENAQKSRELAMRIADAENEYRVKMSKAEDEVRDMKATAKKEIEELKETFVSIGKAEGSRIVAQALSTKEEIRKEIEDQMQEKSVILACRILQKILSSDEQKLVFDGLLESVFVELNKLENDHLKTIDIDAIAKAPVKVKTSHAMSQQQKTKLEEILTAKLKQKITVQEMLDNELITGIVIALGSFMIDGSLSERFKRAAETMEVK